MLYVTSQGSIEPKKVLPVLFTVLTGKSAQVQRGEETIGNSSNLPYYLLRRKILRNKFKEAQEALVEPPSSDRIGAPKCCTVGTIVHYWRVRKTTVVQARAINQIHRVKEQGSRESIEGESVRVPSVTPKPL